LEVDYDRLNPIVADITKAVSAYQRKTPVANIVLATCYKLAQVASNLRATINNGEEKNVIVNFFGFSIMDSGKGKNRTLSTLDSYVFGGFFEEFKHAYKKRKMRIKSERIESLIEEGYDESLAVETVEEEFGGMVDWVSDMEESTPEGLRTMRESMAAVGLGASSLDIDELANNIGKNNEILVALLGIYDSGNSKSKVIKSQTEYNNVFGVPANLIGYGSPDRLFDGGKVEDDFTLRMSEGLARRSFFAYPDVYPMDSRDPVEIVRLNSEAIEMLKRIKERFYDHFKGLCHPKNANVEIKLTDEANIALMVYSISNEEYVESNPKLQHSEKLEIENRNWKVMKLAGVFAFAEGSPELNKNHVEQAIYVAELSTEAFSRMMNQPPIYERLFNFIKNNDGCNIVDIAENKWWRGSVRDKAELFNMAKAFGFRNDYLFRKKVVEGVEFFSFENIPKVDESKCIISVSKKITEGFKTNSAPFNQLHQALCADGIKYSAGTFKNGYRNLENYEGKQNLIIVDIDDGMKMETAKLMFADYKCLIATTKSHQKEKNGVVADRFRIVFLADREINLDTDSYSEFMGNVYDKLGIPADRSCRDASRFYYSAPESEYWYSDGDRLFDITPLIPDSDKNVEWKTRHVEINTSNDALETYFIEQMQEGGRNNAFIRYALILKDDGMDYESIETKVKELNKQIQKPLPVRELERTVLKTIKKRIKE
jgi:hypothetical protein